MNKLSFLGLPLLLLTAIGCQPAAKTPAGAPAAEFQQLLDTSIKELQVKNEAHKAWGLGTFDRWDLDQDAGTLTFTSDSGDSVTTTAQIIGSFSTKDNSWLWAWDNPSIDERLTADARKVKAYGQKQGIEKLTQRKWTGTEDDAWAMTALAVKLCEAQGAYRGPSGNAYVFITFRDVQPAKPTKSP